MSRQHAAGSMALRKCTGCGGFHLLILDLDGDVVTEIQMGRDDARSMADDVYRGLGEEPSSPASGLAGLRCEGQA